ncbi:MAG: hypothetical protein R2710_25195 [Acidimicrobiales bacterium]
MALPGNVAISCGQTDHKPVGPSVGYRFEFGGASVVAAGDTVPCAGLDALTEGADALVHTVIRKDLIANVPVQRMKDTSTTTPRLRKRGARRKRPVSARSVLTHYVPPLPLSGTEDDWRALAASTFDGRVEMGDDLHRVEIQPR